MLYVVTHQALHAKKLGFTHPKKGQWVSFTAPLPEDFSALIQLLREHSASVEMDDDWS